jgi:murein L,D-transpeptidase YcbB/YkuD
MKKTDHQPENRQYQKNHQYQYQDQYGNRYDNRHQNQYDNRYDNRHQDQYGNRYNNPRRYPNDGNMNKRFIDDKRKDNNVHWHATPPAQQAKLNASQLQTVQRRLRNAGHAVSVDGKWGPATARAVRDFQRQQGLNVTGSLDQKTLAALDISNTPSRNR